ncbi:MAG TPA: hypothetical protein VF525_10940 [Pyrinomonadaceae bacterium]|jgi:DNA-directed RNA polymerase specialized sigma24 family protein
MNKEHDITPEDFDALLRWLNPDRAGAGEKYEEIRGALIKLFTCRGCREADRLADETINRVTGKVRTIADTYVGNPALYFYGVAYKVLLEYQRKLTPPAPLPVHVPAPAPAAEEVEYECLDQCMQQLAPAESALIMEYYAPGDDSAAARRKQLAEQLGLPLNALRIRAFRIRAALQECVFRCVAGQTGV